MYFLVLNRFGNMNGVYFRICSMIAVQSVQLRDIHRAVLCYKEVLKHSPEDLKAMTSLARLYMQMNNIGDCQVMCSTILKIDPNNEAASVMMADLSFRRVSVFGWQGRTIAEIYSNNFFQFVDEL